MVKTLLNRIKISEAFVALVLLILYGSCLFASPETVKFVMEFSKNEIYMGERVTVRFTLYAQNTRTLEVEVAKFPEFRGYWSSNLSLKQGPLMLSPDPLDRSWNAAEIGSYLLTPMMGNENPTIKPMKLVIYDPTRTPQQEEPSKYILESQSRPLKIKKLPPFNLSKEEEKYFKGAVGTFSLNTGRMPIFFYTSEPTLLRVFLQGKGNFQEINDLGLPLLPEIELLSKKSILYGGGFHQSKNFELTFSLHSENDLTVPASYFTFFNPEKNKYQSLTIPPIVFRYQPPQISSQNLEETLLASTTPYANWTHHTEWEKTLLFQLSQALLFLGILILAIRKVHHQWTERRKHNPRHKLQLQWTNAKRTFEEENSETFLKVADEMAFHILSKRLGVKAHRITRDQVLRLADDKLKSSTRNQAKELFMAHQMLAYSAQKTHPPKPQALLKALESLVREDC